MNDLLQLAIDAAGGLETWNKLTTVSAHISGGGALWDMKGQSGVLNDVNITVKLRDQWASHSPFIQADWHTSVTADRAAIEAAGGKVIKELIQPRASFKGHTLETPWSDVQLAYFAGYAMWTYFNTTFAFVQPGFKVEEIAGWQEEGETWRRLKVTFPDNIATHSKEQVFYYDSEGWLRRHDYDVEIAANAGAAHYLYDFQEFDGIVVPIRQRIYVRQPDNKPLLPDPVLVKLDFTNVKFK
jgi:hypothetical protein